MSPGSTFVTDGGLYNPAFKPVVKELTGFITNAFVIIEAAQGSWVVNKHGEETIREDRKGKESFTGGHWSLTFNGGTTPYPRHVFFTIQELFVIFKSQKIKCRRYTHSWSGQELRIRPETYVPRAFLLHLEIDFRTHSVAQRR